MGKLWSTVDENTPCLLRANTRLLWQRQKEKHNNIIATLLQGQLQQDAIKNPNHFLRKTPKSCIRSSSFHQLQLTFFQLFRLTSTQKVILLGPLPIFPDLAQASRLYEVHAHQDTERPTCAMLHLSEALDLTWARWGLKKWRWATWGAPINGPIIHE